MRKKQRAPLYLEQMEDRWVPATVRLVGGNLFVSNPLIVNGQAGVTVTATGTNTLQVVDTEGGTGSASLGTYSAVGNLFITGSNAKDNITVDLKGKTFAGNLYVSSGNGNDTVSLLSSTGAGGLAGNTTVATGLGNDTVGLNSTGTTAFAFGGSVQVTSTTGNASVGFGNATTGSTISGDLTVTGAANVILGTNTIPHQVDTIGGNVSITDSQSGQPVNFFGTDSVTVGKNLSLNLGNGADTVQFGRFTVDGDTQLNLGSGTDSTVIRGATFNGNLAITGGTGNDTVALSSNPTNVGGSFNVNLGDGNNLITENPSSSLNVAGNLALTEGNGNDSILLGATVAPSSVSGDLNVHLGSGNNATGLFIIPGGTLNWNSGNGSDTVAIGTPLATPPALNVNMQFGNGDDSVILTGTPGVISGTLNGGGRLTANSFVQDGWTLESPFQLINFP